MRNHTAYFPNFLQEDDVPALIRAVMAGNDGIIGARIS
jgi:hypothetical protein